MEEGQCNIRILMAGEFLRSIALIGPGQLITHDRAPLPAVRAPRRPRERKSPSPSVIPYELELGVVMKIKNRNVLMKMVRTSSKMRKVRMMNLMIRKGKMSRMIVIRPLP